MEDISDKLNFIKIKHFCYVKNTVERIKTQATDWDKVFVKDTSYKELLSKIYKELSKPNNKKTNHPIKK